jgi:hypothetical protein
VDTPSVEIPIALELLNSTDLHLLVDEFFFELHFHCEVVKPCAWTYSVPDTFPGFTLDRPTTLKLFGDLRRVGIRTHFWP